MVTNAARALTHDSKYTVRLVSILVILLKLRVMTHRGPKREQR